MWVDIRDDKLAVITGYNKFHFNLLEGLGNNLKYKIDS